MRNTNSDNSPVPSYSQMKNVKDVLLEMQDSSDSAVVDFAKRLSKALARDCSCQICSRILKGETVRNCDVGTAEEQWSRFEKMCFSNRQPDDPDYCSCKCKVDGGCVNDCALIWAQMPYEEGAVNG